MATTIVFGEHVILVALTLPLLLPALRAVFRAGWRYVAAAVVVGAGASAVATILFTDALIGHSDFITPVVIQKIQPFVAVAGAALLLGSGRDRGSPGSSSRESPASGSSTRRIRSTPRQRGGS